MALDYPADGIVHLIRRAPEYVGQDMVMDVNRERHGRLISFEVCTDEFDGATPDHD